MSGALAVLGVAVAAGIVPTALYVFVLWWFDRYEKEPLWLFSLAFLWGAIPAALLSLLLEQISGLPLGLFSAGVARFIEASTVAPLVEEGVKGLALLGIFFLYRAEFDDVLDGIIYGGVIGFGFAMSENVLYYLGPLSQGSIGGFVLLWLMRALAFGLNHALFTAVTGIGLGVARLSRHTWQRWLAPIAGLAGAVTLHAVHNIFASLAQLTCWSLLVSLISNWGGLIVVLVVVYLCWQQERRWLETQLSAEVEAGIITAAEFGILRSSARRLASYWQAFQKGGRKALFARRRRYGWATELAFRKQQLAATGTAAREMAAIDKLRTRLLAGESPVPSSPS